MLFAALLVYANKLIAEISTPQEADSIRPVPLRGLSRKIAHAPYEATGIRRRNGLFVNKNHATVLSLFFPPSLEQWWNRSPIVGANGQPVSCGLLQADQIVLSFNFTFFHVRHRKHHQH